MSQRYLIPTNLFFHWQDPTPDPNNPDDLFKDFPAPSTGDIYFNVSSQMIRVFYEGAWHDAGGGGGGGNVGEVAIQTDEPSEVGLELWVDTNDAGVYPTNLIVRNAPATGTPDAGLNTVWLEY